MALVLRRSYVSSVGLEGVTAGTLFKRGRSRSLRDVKKVNVRGDVG